MFTLRSDLDRRIIRLRCEGDVTTTDLAGHRRTAVLAARDLGRPFAVLTDLTACADISPTAGEELAETVSQLVPFGLAGELRLVGDDTPERVLDTLDGHEPGFDVDVVTLTSRDGIEAELHARLDRARC